MHDDENTVLRFHGRRPFSLPDEEILDFLGIGEGMRILDVGGADGYYAKKFAARKADVTILDAYDYNFKELNGMGIKTVIGNFCDFYSGRFDMVFMAHVFHDLVDSCKERTLENISKISPSHIGNLDFTKEDFGFGPPVSVKLEKGEVVRDMESIGFELIRERDLQYHYLQLFGKKA